MYIHIQQYMTCKKLRRKICTYHDGLGSTCFYARIRYPQVSMFADS